MVYSVEFRPSVLKSLKKFQKKDLQRIKKRIDEIAKSLPPPAITKMKGDNDFHKVRVGNYRIIYQIHDDILVILVIKIGHRKNVYKGLQD